MTRAVTAVFFFIQKIDREIAAEMNLQCLLRFTEEVSLCLLKYQYEFFKSKGCVYNIFNRVQKLTF